MIRGGYFNNSGCPRLENINIPSDSNECDIKGEEKEKSKIVCKKKVFYFLNKSVFQFLEKGAQYM